MLAHPPYAPVRDAHLRRLLARLAAIVWVAIATLAPPASADRGRWAPMSPDSIGFIPIHAVLMPGDGSPYHSRVLMWNEGHGGEELNSLGAVLGWQPGNDACAETTLAGFTTLGTWNPGANLFCSGHAQLANGKLLVVGGTDDNIRGLNAARAYAVGTGNAHGTWTGLPNMNQHRWYPTATTLRDGRVFVAAGHKYDHLWFFGGLRDGAPPVGGSGDSLSRFGRVIGGNWDPAVLPDADGANGRPPAREGHATAWIKKVSPSDTLGTQIIFGGKDANGLSVSDDVWMLKHEKGDELSVDDHYFWQKLPITGPVPDLRRSDHVALTITETEMVVFGGIEKLSPSGSETVLNDFWRLYKHPVLEDWRWGAVTAAGTAPSARYGHAAVYDALSHRIILFGGAGTAGGQAADAKVYAFTFDSTAGGQVIASSGAWSELAVASGPATRQPYPRKDHAMALDMTSGDNGRIIWLYSGDLDSPSVPSDTLWKLDLKLTPPQWYPYTDAATSPGPRAGHTLVQDELTSKMVLFGGTAIGSDGDPDPNLTPDRFVNTTSVSYPFQWQRCREAPFNLSGHTASLDRYGLVFARIPEIYDPDETDLTRSWSAQPGAAWYQEYYPLHFLVPGSGYGTPGTGGRVLAVGQDRYAYALDIPARGAPAGAWQPFGGTYGDAGFYPSTGVCYQPGKLMIAGGRSPWIAPLGQSPVGATRTLDALSPAGWQSRSSMVSRYFHNLVALPTGQVLAVGGMHTTVDGENANPSYAQYRPQIWTPPSSGSPASWTSVDGSDRLASDEVVRNYHSTALLLPDGRVLSGGGWGANPDRARVRIFCPPYLFKADGVTLAPRPEITGAPARVTWRMNFTVCVADTTGIRGACLIRPGATTHGLDQNQRFVPLAIQGRDNHPPRLFVTAPASPDSAPPGDYLLFLTGATDGATAYPEVPSIARWVRLAPAGPDLCDVVDPGTITDLVPDVIGSTAAWFTWTATADDGVVTESGPEREFELRRGLVPITNEGTWAIATAGSQITVPGAYGAPASGQVTGLQPGTVYHAAVRASDDNGRLSGLPSTVTFQTTSGGGGGEEFSARRADGGDEGAGAATPVASASGPNSEASGVSSALSPGGRGAATTTSATGLQPASGTLVVETRQASAGAWQIAMHLLAAPAGSDPPASAITVERSDAGGERDTVGRFEPGAGDNLLGLCALREGGRLGIPGVYRLEQVLPHLRTRGGDYLLEDARHSRLGALGAGGLSDTAGIGLLEGDSLTLTYAPAAETPRDAASWYVLVRRTSDAPPIPMATQRGQPGESLPTRFALHQNRPNPFRGTTAIAFDLPVESPVRLDVFDLLGRRVVTLADGRYPAGSHAVEWDLREANGVKVTPGVYLYRLSAGTFHERRKMSVLP